jgi:hypothetical protein
LFFIPKIIPPFVVFPDPHKIKEGSVEVQILLFCPPAINPFTVPEI